MYVGAAFHKLIEQLQPTPAGIHTGRGHAQAIGRRLEQSFGFNKHIFIGSTARNTAIRHESDVDLLAVLPRRVVQWGYGWISSDTFLNKIKHDLDLRFHATAVRRDQQAIVLSFAMGSEPVDVVPALFHQFNGHLNLPSYLIPDGAGGWLETAPAAHNSYIQAAKTRSTDKLRKVIQLMKHWRRVRSPHIPLTSIHLELLLASSRVCETSTPFWFCLCQALNLLYQRDCRGLQDPLGLAGVLYAAKTDRQREQLNAAVAHSHEHARRAVLAEYARNWPEALRQWSIVFNGSFPA
jgi:hypothetical protein